MSGTIYGSRATGSQYSPRLMIKWSIVKQDEVRNRSQVRAELWLNVSGPVVFSAGKAYTLSVHPGGGTSSGTYTRGGNGRRDLHIATRTTWVNHNSDGTLSGARMEASLKLDITFTGVWTGTIRVSGSYSAPRINRQSTLNSASLDNLQPSTSARLSLGFSVWSTHSNTIELRDENTVIQSWNPSSRPSSLTVSSANVNKIIDSMPNTASKNLTVRVTTKNGSTTLGSNNRTVSATLHSSMRPNVTLTHYNLYTRVEGGLVVADYGDNPMAEATPSRGSKITDGRVEIIEPDGTVLVTGRDDPETNISVSQRMYQGNARYRKSGEHTLRATFTDSRGRTGTDETKFNVGEWSSPVVNVRSVERETSDSITVKLTVEAMSGFTIYYSLRDSSGNRVNPFLDNDWHLESEANGSTIITKKFTGTEPTMSYELGLNVTDDNNISTNRTVTIGTARQLLTFNEDKGIGIGKFHEHGALDVDGDIYVGGDQNRINTVGDSGHFNISAGTKDLYLRGRRILLTTSNIVSWSGSGSDSAATLIESGSNSNGSWIKFYDGTLIAYNSISVTRSGNWSAVDTWEYPVRFDGGRPYVTASFDNRSNVANLGELEHAQIFLSPTTSNVTVRLKPVTGNRFLDTSLQTYVNLIAIGRWK